MSVPLLGEIVQAADSHPATSHPVGAGLRWIAHGFSGLGSTDREIVDRESIVHGALDAECRRRVSTTENATTNARALFRPETTSSVSGRCSVYPKPAHIPRKTERREVLHCWLKVLSPPGI
jgi:hypothetical protein